MHSLPTLSFVRQKCTYFLVPDRWSSVCQVDGVFMHVGNAKVMLMQKKWADTTELTVLILAADERAVM